MLPDSYFDRFHTAKYQSKNPLQRALIRRFVGRLHELFIAACPVDSVLEIGVGEGFLSGYLSEKFPEKRFAGVDLLETDLARLREKFPRIETHQASVYDIAALAGGPFELVLCCEVLEHLDAPEAALDAILALEPRRVILTVPHEPWFMLSNLLRGKNVTRFGNDIEHVNHWGRQSLKALLESRFRILELTTSYPWILALLEPR